MTAEALLADLVARDVRLSAAGDNLRINAPRGALTAELRQTLLDNKPELLEALRQRTPGQYLADLSLWFAGHTNHHAALDYFCVSADEYRQKHGMSGAAAASHGYTAAVFEYGDGGAAAMLPPSTLAKLPRSSAPIEQYHFVYPPPPQKRSGKRRQQREGGGDER